MINVKELNEITKIKKSKIKLVARKIFPDIKINKNTTFEENEMSILLTWLFSVDQKHKIEHLEENVEGMKNEMKKILESSINEEYKRILKKKDAFQRKWNSVLLKED